jgi:hypothetical protein
VLIWNLRKDSQTIERQVREEDLEGMEENGRREEWKSGKDVETSWGLGPKQNPLEILPGSSMFLKEWKEIIT